MILWDGGFKDGIPASWSGYESNAPADRLQVVDAPGRPGTKALRVLLKQQDFIPRTNGVRNELFEEFLPDLCPEGSERWYKWSTLFPESYPVIQQWQVWTQWHQSYHPDGTSVGRSPPVEFAINKDKLQFNINPVSGGEPRTLWTLAIPRGWWMDLVLHVRWAADLTGFVELHIGGDLVVPRTPAITVFPGLGLPSRPNFLKQGLYRAQSVVPDAVLYHQGMFCADAAADVGLVPVAAPTLFVGQDVAGGVWTATVARGIRTAGGKR